jgi:hypothetical protein
VKHYTDEDLTLYYYGEARRPAAVERHLGECASCRATFDAIATTLSLIPEPIVPERGELYGLEVWQRIRHQLPVQDSTREWFPWTRLMIAGAAAAIVLVIAVAFVAGRRWPLSSPAPSAPTSAAATPVNERQQRVLLAAVAEHLDRSDRVLTDVMNAPAGEDISAAQRWADDLLTTSRLYRQDAIAAGEQSVASVLDELERSLLEIVHSPSKISAEDLDQIRRRIDAAALLFKVRVMSEELRRDQQRARADIGRGRPLRQTS